MHSGHEQFENAGAIDPEHLQVMRRGQLDVAMKLAKVEDGHASSIPNSLPGEAYDIRAGGDKADFHDDADRAGVNTAHALRLK